MIYCENNLRIPLFQWRNEFQSVFLFIIQSARSKVYWGSAANLSKCYIESICYILYIYYIHSIYSIYSTYSKYSIYSIFMIYSKNSICIVFILVQQRVRLFVITLSNPLSDDSSMSKINKKFKQKFLSIFRSFFRCEFIE